MTFAEKLKQLLGDRSRSKVAEQAGLKPSALSSYINQGTQPLASAALRLARALDVPLDWLADESQGFPVPRFDLDRLVMNLSDEALIREACRRLDNSAGSVEAALMELASVDWPAVATNALAIPLDDQLPRDIDRIRRLTETVYDGLEGLARFDASEVFAMHSISPRDILKLQRDVEQFTTSKDKFVSAFLHYVLMRRLTVDRNDLERRRIKRLKELKKAAKA